MSSRTECPKKIEIKQRQRVYDGFYKLDRIELTHELFQGGMNKPIVRELMVRPDAVCVLLYDATLNKVLFTQQFRVGAMGEDSAWLFELVAGLIDKDESPEEVGRREAIEEAGVAVGEMQFIAQYLPSPGGTQEKVHLYIAEADLADVDGGVHGLEEEGEDIKVHVISFAEAQQWVQAGKLNNPACLISLMWLQANHAQMQSRWAKP